MTNIFTQSIFSMTLTIAQKAKDLYEKYERHVGIGLMALGFTVDNLTLKRIDLPFENLVLFIYLMISLTSIVAINAYSSGRLQYTFMHSLHTWLTLPMQYAFGGLFSGFFIFYSRSASFIASWPFLIMLAALLVGNELARTKYARFTYQITIFYTALISFAIFYIPVLTKRIGADIFLLSGVVSLLGISAVLFLLRNLAPERFQKSKNGIIASIAIIFFLFNVMYFTNIIPPIPLSLKAIGIYHSIERRDSGYTAYAEASKWYQLYNNTSRVFHRYDNEPIFVFSSVFAPTDLKTPIFHRWSLYDEKSRRWIAKDRLSFSIVGGRDGGYRGYSYKQNIQAGKWRVDVITKRNQLIGRITFTVTAAKLPPQTKLTIL